MVIVKQNPAPEAISAAYTIHGALFNPKSPDYYSPEGFKALLEGNGVRLFTLEDQKKGVLGYILFRGLGIEAEILSLGVNKSSQSQGYGKALINGLLEHLKASGCLALFLEVSAENKPAQALYRSFGAEQIGTRKNYFKDATGKPISAILQKIPVR